MSAPDEKSGKTVPVIKRLMTPAPQLQFGLTAPAADAPVNGEDLHVSGWVATADPLCQLLIETCGVQQTFSMEQASPDVARKFTNEQSSLTVFEFKQRLQAERPILMGTVRVGVTMNGVLYWLYAITPPEYSPKGVLFGGSNSITSGGIADGLKNHLPHMKNLAAGASSSLQNLFELLRHKDDILNSDFVITESNVNDSHIAHTLSNLSLVLENIDWFYRELSLFEVPVYVLMLPLSRDGSAPESPKVVDAINQCHRKNAHRYGYNLIDVDGRFAALTDNQMNLMMANERHPIQIFMHRLGENLARHLIDDRRRLSANDSNRLEGLQHSVTLFDEHQNKKVRKSNTRFDEWLYPLSEPTEISRKHVGKQVVGIATWSDDFSSAMLANRHTQVVKRFTPFVAFSEILESFHVDDATTLSPNHNLPETEKSMSVPADARIASEPKIMGVLFRNANAALSFPEARGAFPLPEVIPELSPYVYTMNYLVHKGRFAPAPKTSFSISRMLPWNRKSDG